MGVRQAADVEWYVVLKVFSGFGDCANQPDSWHQYGPGSPAQQHHGYSYVNLTRILEEENAAEARGILHSFTASLETAEAAIDHGFLISFSGIVTFKNAESLQAVARVLPLDKILVETDCPYLAPVPHRGKRNEPVFVKETAAFLARLKGVSEASVEAATDANFQKFFGI